MPHAPNSGNPPVSMADVACRAGVARSTVSMALRNHPSIGSATRRRIQELAIEMGYQPNPMVSALMRNRRASRMPARATTIGLVCPVPVREWQEATPTFGRIYRGILAQVANHGFGLDSFSLDGTTPERISSIMGARGIRGFLVAPLVNPLNELALDWDSFAAVAIGYSLRQVPIHRAAPHQHQEMMVAMRKLWEMGYRRIGLAVEAEVDRRVYHHWLAGFLAREFYFGCRGELPVLLMESPDPEEFHAWVERERPEVVIGHTSGPLQWLVEGGRRVPEDIGFVALDWSAPADYAGIDPQFELVGAAAVDLLVEEIYHNRIGVPPHPKVVLIEGAWVDGPTLRPQNGCR